MVVHLQAEGVLPRRSMSVSCLLFLCVCEHLYHSALVPHRHVEGVDDLVRGRPRRPADEDGEARRGLGVRGDVAEADAGDGGARCLDGEGAVAQSLSELEERGAREVAVGPAGVARRLGRQEAAVEVRRVRRGRLAAWAGKG